MWSCADAEELAGGRECEVPRQYPVRSGLVLERLRDPTRGDLTLQGGQGLAGRLGGGGGGDSSVDSTWLVIS